MRAQHKVTEVLGVAGRRPSTASRPGGLILVEDRQFIGVATLALAEAQRHARLELIERHGRGHPSERITIPEDALKASVHYTCRTPTHGHLREAFVVAIHPATG
jgi:hypothetical protein